jgi:hypothetical protein
MVRLNSPRRSSRGFEFDQDASAAAQPAASGEIEESGGEYGVIPDTESAEGKRKRGTAASAGGTWVPTRGKSPESGRSVPRSCAISGRSPDLLERIRKPVELPGPFFKMSALVYPWLHPNWVRWLGLSFMTSLAVGAISVTLFVAWIVIRSWALLSIFAVGSMSLVCAALVSYVIASFVNVIEETASGEDRLEGMIDLSWWDMLPAFLQALGAGVVTSAVTIGVTYPLRWWFPWDAQALILTQAIIMFQLFPILLITNLVDSSWFPFKSLPATMRRLAACVGTLVAFWVITAPVIVAAVVALSEFFRIHVGAGVAAAGPIGAAALMFYGHWLGRLARQLSDVD